MTVKSMNELLNENARLQQRVNELLAYNNEQVFARRAIAQAARKLRAAQRTYLADRGNEVLGKTVRFAGEDLDIALGDAPPRKKILLLGYGRHGKDTVAEILRDDHGYRFMSSSLYAAEHVCRPYMEKLGFTYDTLEECYNDRHTGNNRAHWYDAIKAFNAEDPAALAKGILEIGDIYVGMRADYEYQTAKHLFDEIWWVDALGRGLPVEDRSSMDIDFNPDEMKVISNNGTLSELRQRVSLILAGFQPFYNRLSQ